MKLTAIKLIGLVLLAALLGACQKELQGDSALRVTGQTFNLTIDFKAFVDAEPLVIDKGYRNSFQEPFSVKVFEYYICNIRLINSDLNIVSGVNKGEHFLIDASTPTNTTVSAKPPAQKYNYLSFTIGVDSARNTSGAQTGALDPAKGMFWTWNTGYIMAKLEGSSPLTGQPNNKFEYHIGGFKGAENVIENVLLPFPNAQVVEFTAGSSGTITLHANVNAWFNNPNEIHLGKDPVCTTPGGLAKKIAENYSKMFTVTEVVNR